MQEWIAILFGCCLGSVVFMACRRLMQILVGAAGTILAALAVTVVSGEYHASWVYLLVDWIETVAGFGSGVAVIQFICWVKLKGDLVSVEAGRVRPLQGLGKP